jgi:NAD(P)-dependent dehydrogenase (short-subunit alcohol dehydrogenase family)
MASRNDRPLDGQSAVVLGGSSGIGLAAAAELAALGAHTVIAGRDRSRLDTALASLPSGTTAHEVDVTSPSSLQALAAAVSVDGIDHLVLAAGASDGIGPVAGLDLAALRRGLDTKVVGFVGAVQALAPTIAKSGSITFVSARSASRSAPGAAGLAAINGAVEALVPSLAAELAPIRVNAVSPGVVDTAWWSAFPDDLRRAIFEQYASGTTIGRIGTAADVALAIAAVALNPNISGVVLPCDGGAGVAA